MTKAVTNEAWLGRIMDSEAGSLDGLAAARQDLWRLGHMAMYLRAGMTALHESGSSVDAKSAASLAGRLRRRFRKALIAYARSTLRSKGPKTRLIADAREAALAEIGKRGVAEAERLADIEGGGEPKNTVIRLGVAKPLLDLGSTGSATDRCRADASSPGLALSHWPAIRHWCRRPMSLARRTRHSPNYTCPPVGDSRSVAMSPGQVSNNP